MSHSRGQTAGTEALSWWVAPVTKQVPPVILCTPHSHRVRPGFPTSLTPGFPQQAQTSHSIKPLTHGTVTQKHLELLPPKRTQEWNPCTFIPSQSTCTQISLFLPSLLVLLLSFSMSTLLASLVFICFVIQKVGSSWLLLCPSVSIHLAGTTGKVGTRGQGWQPMVSLCPHAEQNLISNCSLHTDLPAPKVFLKNLLIKPFFKMPLEVPSAGNKSPSIKLQTEWQARKIPSHNQNLN